MAEIGRVALFGKLNQVGYKSIEAATVFCKMRGNPVVELQHWIHQILQLQDSDLHRIIKQFNLEPSRLAADITDSLERLPRGSTSISDLSSNIEDAVERGWVLATLMFGEAQVRSGYLIAGILQTRHLKSALHSISKEFEKITFEKLCDQFDEVVGDSPENHMHAHDGFQVGGGAVPGEASGAMAPAQMGKQEALEQFTVDLTEQARNGEIDPIVGRDEEIRQLVDILMRRRQNNPILTGEAGVGKTAVVEGFALRIAAGDVPPPLRDVSLKSLDVGLLQAGASMKGEFENRLKQVIEEVQSSEKPIIMFIDEAHTLIGAGGAAGTGDAANLLKPALARGTLRTVAATTWAEYKKHIEKDPALTRRFQVVQVEEPSETKAILMMRSMASVMEKHHKVQLLDEAIEASVKLSSRYIQGRQLPDKSVSLLDTACARVAISHHAVPAEVDDSRRRIAALEQELEIIHREKDLGVEADERELTARASLDAEQTRLAGLEERWNREKELVDQILDIRAQLRGEMNPVEGTQSELEAEADAEAETVGVVGLEGEGSVSELDPAARSALTEQLKSLQTELKEAQGETPLILPTVDEVAIGSVVADWTGIPVGRMVKDEVETVLNLAEHMKDRIVGQDHALEMIARRIQTSRANLDNPGKPIGVFMLAGPSSGVGKTESAALALAEALYGGEQNVITINMSEFQEAHTVSTLKGAPPGTSATAKAACSPKPCAGDPTASWCCSTKWKRPIKDVHESLLSRFLTKGRWKTEKDGVIDFKNTIILLTSNVGTDLIMNMCKDPELMPDPEGISTALREPLLKVFPPALLGRLVVIPYYPLSEEMINAISRIQLDRVKKRVEEHHKVPFSYSDDVIKLIASRCTDLDSGGRMIDAILTNSVLPAISEEILKRMIEGNPISKVDVQVANSEFQYAFD